MYEKRPAKARKMKASAEEWAAIKHVRARLKANMAETLWLTRAEVELKGLQAELKALDQVVEEGEEAEERARRNCSLALHLAGDATPSTF
jgi:hypothetical protein